MRMTDDLRAIKWSDEETIKNKFNKEKNKA